MLKTKWSAFAIEAGCDEAGRGSLCGPVVAAAVIITPEFYNELINDSKKLSSSKRALLELYIKNNAMDYAISEVSAAEIDHQNILNASISAMHLAVEKLSIQPDVLLIDGNRFHPYKNIPHECIIKGDGLVVSIAAASILAKNYRDKILKKMHHEFPEYGWNTNMGYATEKHRSALNKYGPTKYHRTSFRLQYDQ